MGKILKKLLDKKILDSKLEIELNKEPSDKSSKVVHLSENLCGCTPSDFDSPGNEEV